MALQKTIQLPNGVTGSYIRVGNYRWDGERREASAYFLLFSSGTFAKNKNAQAITEIAKLRLNGDRFDAYLANPVLGIPGNTVVGQLYKAAKSEPLLSCAGLPAPQLNLPAVDLSDATDV